MWNCLVLINLTRLCLCMFEYCAAVQGYLKLLLQALDSKASSATSSAQARVAARCMCGMLSALHHFNYSTDLLQAVVPLMIHKDDQLRQLSCDAVREVLVNDEEGKVAVEAVQLVSSCCSFSQYVLLPSAKQPTAKFIVHIMALEPSSAG